MSSSGCKLDDLTMSKVLSMVGMKPVIDALLYIIVVTAWLEGLFDKRGELGVSTSLHNHESEMRRWNHVVCHEDRVHGV